jgi:hypothetical protein
MKTRRFGKLAKLTAITVASVIALLPSTYAAAQLRVGAIRRAMRTPKPQLPEGWTQLLTPEQWKQVEAQRANRLTQRTYNTTTVAYTNDQNGNVLTDGVRTNTWDSQNRLVQCVKGGITSQFLYGADGNRRQTSVNNGTTTTVRKNVLDNGMLLRELDGSTSAATYFQGASGPVYRRNDSITGQPIVWYVYDGLGSVACELNPNGTVAARKKTDVYGMAGSRMKYFLLLFSPTLKFLALLPNHPSKRTGKSCFSS